MLGLQFDKRLDTPRKLFKIPRIIVIALEEFSRLAASASGWRGRVDEPLTEARQHE